MEQLMNYISEDSSFQYEDGNLYYISDDISSGNISYEEFVNIWDRFDSWIDEHSSDYVEDLFNLA